MQEIKTDKAPAAIGPYSQGAAGSGLVFVSGQLPINVQTGVMETEPANAARQCLKNIEAILEAKNLTMANVLKMNIFLTNMEDFALVNEAYAEFFKQPYPARACVEVKGLPKNAVIEIEAIAEL